MDDYTNESAEMQEVADLADDVDASAENQEVADLDEDESIEEPEANEPTSGKTDADKAFAEMRRRNQELEAQNRRMTDALSKYFEGETADDLYINALANFEEVSPEEYRQQYEHDIEFERLRTENEALHNQLIDAEVDKLMEEGLREVREIDPNIKSLDELGGQFARFISGGLSTKEAYYATKAIELKEKVYAPDAIGRVADTKIDRDYYTSAELDALTDEEMDANWDKVMKSMARLGK